MKHLKYFETTHKDMYYRYWKIPTTEPYLTISLNKIPNCKINKQDVYRRINSDDALYNDNYIYIIQDTSSDNNNLSWYWSDDNSKVKYFKYMGEITITDDDIKKYNLENDTNKYNL